MLMGVDLYLNSVWEPWWADNMERVLNEPDVETTSDAASNAAAASKMFDEMRASGAYFRNGYNSGDVMWAMGLSWPHSVGCMLDSEGYLPVKRARELLAMIEARPLTEERLTQHYFSHHTRRRAASDHRLALSEIARAADTAAKLRNFRRLFAAAPHGADRASRKIGRSQRAAALLRLSKQTSNESAFEREYASAIHRAHPPISTLSKEAV